VRTLYLGIVVVIALGEPVQKAEGQRLVPGFPSATGSPLIFQAAFSSVGHRLQYRPRECRLSPVLRVAVGGAAGAAAGWLAYEVTLGFWVSGEGATPDATVRRIRTTCIVSGAILGVLRAVHASRECSADDAGA
jgi:hypothetical protein